MAEHIQVPDLDEPVNAQGYAWAQRMLSTTNAMSPKHGARESLTPQMRRLYDDLVFLDIETMVHPPGVALEGAGEAEYIGKQLTKELHEAHHTTEGEK